MRAAIGRALWKIGDALALGYDGGEGSRMRKDLGWARAVARDEDSMLGPDKSRETLRLKATDLRRNNPIVAGVCERLASFTVGAGIHPQAATDDAKWNKAAEEYFAQRMKIIDCRGRASGWQLQRMCAGLRPTHGGLYFELLDSGQIRPIECERIRQPQDAATAKAFTDGVKVHKETGIRLGYMVHSRDESGGFGGKHAERYVDAANMLAVVTPFWRPDQVREVPDLAPVIPALTDIHEANLYTLATYKAQSGYIAFHKKQGGAANAGVRGSTPAVGARQTFKKEWGEILQGLPGEDLDLKSSPTPNAQHIPYVKLCLTLAAPALDLPYEFFTLDFSGCDMSRQKAVLLMVNKAIRNWQAWLNETFNQRLWNWLIARAMKNGELAQAPVVNGVSQWFRVDWQAPEEPWTDRQEAQQSDLLECQMGLGTMFRAAKKRGYTFEDNLYDNADALAMVERVAREKGVDPAKLFIMQIPGQTAADAAKKTTGDKTTTVGAEGGA